MKNFLIIWDTTHEGWLRVVSCNAKTCEVARTLDINQATGFSMAEIELYGMAKSSSRIFFQKPGRG